MAETGDFTLDQSTHCGRGSVGGVYVTEYQYPSHLNSHRKTEKKSDVTKFLRSVSKCLIFKWRWGPKRCSDQKIQGKICITFQAFIKTSLGYEENTHSAESFRPWDNSDRTGSRRESRGVRRRINWRTGDGNGSQYHNSTAGNRRFEWQTEHVRLT